jgi:hypothetical protein
MHLVVSWDITASGERWTAINDNLKEGLNPYSWARPLSTFYVVKVSGEPDRIKIRDALLERARAVHETVHFVISPLMQAGRYDGYLPRDMWDKINQRTD